MRLPTRPLLSPHTHTFRSFIQTVAHLQPECPHCAFVLDIVITLHGISILHFSQGRWADDNWMTHLCVYNNISNKCTYVIICIICMQYKWLSGKALFYLEVIRNSPKTLGVILTFKHRASSILGQAFRYSPENAFYVFNQQIYFIIWYLLDRASLI